MISSNKKSNYNRYTSSDDIKEVSTTIMLLVKSNYTNNNAFSNK